MLNPTLSSTARMLHPTGYLLPSRGGIPYRPYSLHSSTVPLYRTARSGCRTTPAGHHPHKKCAVVSSLTSAPVLPYRYLFHQIGPVSYHCVYHHIKYGGGQRIYLSHPPEPLKTRPIVSPYTHRWELPGNYPVFTVVMVIYHYVERIWRILVTPIFIYNIYNH